MPSNFDFFSHVERLQHENLRLKRIGLAVLVLASAALVMGQSPSTRTVEAEAFVLKDSRGNIRARLGTENGATELLFYNPAGQPHMALKMDAKGEALEMRDNSGKLLATMAVAWQKSSPTAPTTSTIAALGTPGGPGVIMQAWTDGTILRVSDKHGHQVWAAPQP